MPRARRPYPSGGAAGQSGAADQSGAAAERGGRGGGRELRLSARTGVELDKHVGHEVSVTGQWMGGAARDESAWFGLVGWRGQRRPGIGRRTRRRPERPRRRDGRTRRNVAGQHGQDDLGDVLGVSLDTAQVSRFRARITREPSCLET